MREKELRRSLAVLPIGTVMKLTDLSARQIRYYEEHQLVVPQRTKGNHRMYSLNDVDRLLEIRTCCSTGLTLRGLSGCTLSRSGSASNSRLSCSSRCQTMRCGGFSGRSS